MAVLGYKTTDKDGGQTIYNLHFGHLTSNDDKKNNPAPDHWNPNEPGRMRIIDQHIVGTRIKDSESSKGNTYAKKPGNCVHPETSMKRRANGKVTWFTCMDCGARWNRLPCVAENQHLHAPLDKEVLSFGKFAGWTMSYVYQNFPEYCDWACKAVENEKSPGEGLKRLALYSVQQESKTASRAAARDERMTTHKRSTAEASDEMSNISSEKEFLHVDQP